MSSTETDSDYSTESDESSTITVTNIRDFTNLDPSVKKLITPHVLARKQKQNKMTKEAILERFDTYFTDLSNRGFCVDMFRKGGTKKKCDCLASLSNVRLRKSVSLFAFDFSQRSRKHRMETLVNWYKYANPDKGNPRVFLMPIDVDETDLNLLDEEPICNNTITSI